MTITPTPEQLKIYEFARNSKRSLLVNALAGAAKTTTLVGLVSHLPLVPILSCAFNKKIAEEMSRRLPGHVQSSTMNSLGHRVWGKTISRRLTLDTDKGYANLRQFVDAKRPEQRSEYNEIFAAILRGVRLAKSNGYVPPKARTMAKTLVMENDLIASLNRQLDTEVDDQFMEALDSALLLSIAQSFEGKIDFDDQIYMSTLFGGDYPKFPIVLVDEAQDLSSLNHVTVGKLFGGRVIAVGDPWQSIYGFRGAHQNSMTELRKQFDMEEMTLSISFRCPIKVVENAHFRVPHMRYSDFAIEGKVERLATWALQDIPDYSAVICRNNAPLFGLAMKLIRAGRGVHLVGNDIGTSMVKLMKKLAPKVLDREAFLTEIDQWQNIELGRASKERHAGINDRAECLRVFANTGKTSEEAIAWAERLFNSSGPISLMTGHKAKGLEFDVVYHLNSFLVPSKWARVAAEQGDPSQMEQELNIKYVIETRAKRELYFINMDDLDG